MKSKAFCNPGVKCNSIDRIILLLAKGFIASKPHNTTGVAGKKLKMHNRLSAGKSITARVSFADTGGVNEFSDQEPLF